MTTTTPGRAIAPPGTNAQHAKPAHIPYAIRGIDAFLAERRAQPDWPMALCALGDLMQKPIAPKPEAKS